MQTAAILIALPFSVVMLLMCWSTTVALQRERRAYQPAQRAQLLNQIGTYYGLEVGGHEDGELQLPAWLKRRQINAFRRHRDANQKDEG